jgi:hypothetical protein
MPRFGLVALIALSSLALTSCSVFYPNLGATSLPEESETSQTQTSEPDQAPSETPAGEAAETAEPTASETSAPEIIRKETPVEIIMVQPEPAFGVLTVIAQMPSLSESNGSCTLRFLSGSVEKTLKVQAEPSSDYTQCYPIELPLKGLPKGTAVVTVSYDSDYHFGTSSAQSVVIP